MQAVDGGTLVLHENLPKSRPPILSKVGPASFRRRDLLSKRKEMTSMVEVRDLLQSKELKETVAAIEALVRAHGSTITSPLDSFPSLTYGRRFQAERILQILLADGESFAGFKDVLAAGFAGWLLHLDRNLSSHCPRLCRRTMA